MASLAMHLAIAEEYMKRNAVQDRNLFLDGSLAPDLGSDQIASHFGSYEKPKTIIEFLKTRMNLAKYLEEVQISNDFDSGYFLHMIADDLFYQYLYTEEVESKTPEQIRKEVYSDYDFVTQHILSFYKIETDRIKKWSNNKKGKPVYFTPQGCDAFIAAVSKVDLQKAEREIRADLSSFRENFFKSNKIKTRRQIFHSSRPKISS